MSRFGRAVALKTLQFYLRTGPVAHALATAEAKPRLLAYMALALRDCGMRYLTAANGVGRLRRPKGPAGEIFLKKHASPNIVAVAEQHLAV